MGAFTHCTVMPHEVIDYLQVKHGGTYIDATLGGGGHTEQILQQLEGSGTVYGIDRDNDALQAAGKRLVTFGSAFVGIKGCFDEMKELLIQHNVSEVDGVVMDLGVSSYQLDTPERGFSFRADGPLDMRMDATQRTTAADIVRDATEAELHRIISVFGEERWAKRIAGHIVSARQLEPIETTTQLALIIRAAIPKRFHEDRIDPATRTFQALRIAVNQELEQVERGVRSAIDILAPGGRIVVISFHSLEDRLVKTIFRESATGCICPPKLPICQCGVTPRGKVLTARPITASAEEIDQNPRARSAKLRAFERK